MSQPDAIVAEIPRLRRYARALTGEDARADDLVQDTLERALGKWALWRQGSDLRAWLFAIMHNLFVTGVRAKTVVEFTDEPPDMLQRPEQADALGVRDLDRALARLPLEQREVLLLVGLEELSYADTAKALGIPLGTVMSRLARGREKLRAILEGREPASALKVVK